MAPRRPVRIDRSAAWRALKAHHKAIRDLHLRDLDEVAAEGVPARQISQRTFVGNHPTNTVLASKLTPRVLGELIATYEHKVFTQETIWRINSFDQSGVELGKALAGRIGPELESQAPTQLAHDSSTNTLISDYRQARGRP